MAWAIHGKGELVWAVSSTTTACKFIATFGMYIFRPRVAAKGQRCLAPGITIPSKRHLVDFIHNKVLKN
jgi:hypothetical protein